MQLVHTFFEPEGDGPYPTVLALHGWGANAMDLLGIAPHLCSGRFLVICPQGPVEVPLGPGAVGYGWFPLALDAPPDVPAILAARDNLRLFLDACAARYPIDRRKLVLLGFSQGGVMAYGLAFREAERYSAVAVLSSWLPQEFVNASPNIANSQYPPMLIQHGLHDELIEVDRARESVEALRSLRVPVTYREYEMGHQITQRSLADLSAWLGDKVLSPIVLAT